MANNLKVAPSTGPSETADGEPKPEAPAPVAFVIPAGLTDAIMTIVTRQPWTEVNDLITAFRNTVQPVYAKKEENEA